MSISHTGLTEGLIKLPINVSAVNRDLEDQDNNRAQANNFSRKMKPTRVGNSMVIWKLYSWALNTSDWAIESANQQFQFKVSTTHPDSDRCII